MNPYIVGGMAAFQIINGLQQAELTRSQAEVTQMITDMNLQYNLNDQFETLANGLSEEARYSNAVKNVLETQKSNLAYAGVDASYGSAADVQADSKVQGLVNAATMRNQTYAKVFGLKQDALNIKLQGQFDQSAAKQKAAAQVGQGVMNGISTTFKAYTADASLNTAKKDQGGAESIGGGYDLPDVSQFSNLV